MWPSFFRIKGLPEPVYSVGVPLPKGLEFVKLKSIHPMIYNIVVNGLATYYDIMHKYDMDELLDLCEILIVKQENEAIYRESLKKKEV